MDINGACLLLLSDCTLGIVHVGTSSVLFCDLEHSVLVSKTLCILWYYIIKEVIARSQYAFFLQVPAWLDRCYLASPSMHSLWYYIMKEVVARHVEGV